MVTVVCLKWGVSFPAIHVNVLYEAVKRHLPMPFRFVCLTDDAEGLAEGIVSMPIPDMGLEPERWAEGCWAKLAMFKRGVLPEGEIVIFLDLDLIIQKDLTPFVEQVRTRRGLHSLREWNPTLWSLLPLSLRPDRGVQSALLGFYPEDVHYIFDDFVADKALAYSQAHNDQSYLTVVAKDRTYWPDEWCVSFKRACVWYYPLSLVFSKIRRPKRAKVIIFHGDPRPWDLIGEPGQSWGTNRRRGNDPVEWVKDYYRLASVDLD